MYVISSQAFSPGLEKTFEGLLLAVCVLEAKMASQQLLAVLLCLCSQQHLVTSVVH